MYGKLRNQKLKLGKLCLVYILVRRRGSLLLVLVKVKYNEVQAVTSKLSSEISQ